ncbi:multicopper oxidase [Lachnospiraceae bacterium KM106-2]|nr:multicopper oxidase [Lachnospiraceae bacterium KM106-2]
MIRHFDVTAIKLPIVYNKYGDVDPDGLMYVLNENREMVEEQVERCPGTFVNLVQPLVIRANRGDIVEITFTNDLCFSAGINVKGLDCNIQNSDGAFVGINENSLVPPCETRTYRWDAEVEGAFLFTDLGNPLSSEIGSNVHGLFGTIVIETPGSFWTDPQTGCELKSGVFADVHHPFLPDFREFVTVFHDEAPVKNRFLEDPWDPHMDAVGMTHSINYRSEPMRNRLHLIEEGIVCPECKGEEVHHDSWVFGDPPDTILPRCYEGDPVRWHVMDGGMQETHIFHLHLQQWLDTRRDPGSKHVDSKSISPGGTLTFDINYGAGSLQHAYGDVIFHCHLYPHFDEGMWGIQRIHNVLEDGTRCYPDGTPITRLIPLPDIAPPPLPTPEKPGFPLFIPGKFGNIAPTPPIGFDRDFPITELEENALAPNAVEGALFTNPCPDCVRIHRFDIVAIQLPLIYNEACWHDPEGRIYVLAEDEEDILCGKKKPEPLFLHANPNECVEIHFTNHLPEQLGPNAFQIMTETILASPHVHLVKFDPLTSDGANTGWNYMTGTEYKQTVVYRWYADIALRYCFFHDHLFANSNQLHGLFGGIVIEPLGSIFRNNFTGELDDVGSQLAIENPFIPDFREFCLAVADWIPAYDRNDKPLNAPPRPGIMQDMGIMAFNYASAPFRIRDGDPAYVFSSFVHGDPWTPVFEGYEGDPVRLRLIDGSHEESHSINFNRFRWKEENHNLDSNLIQQQHMGISEAFTFQFALEAPDGPNVEKDFDTLYYSGGMDDLWLGVWGLVRTRGTAISGLYQLGDRPRKRRRTEPLPKRTGKPPKPAVLKSNPFPPGTKVHRYHVAAIQTNILYNKFGDHDPYGMTFVPYDDVPKILRGEMNPEPLIISINSAEGIELTLTNLMPKHLDVPQFPEVPVDQKWPYSSRVSMHSQTAFYDVLDSDGTTVGFNPDQTIGVGESITYRWMYPFNADQGILVDFGDVRNHRNHGLFGAINLTAPGSAHYDNVTKQPSELGDQIQVTNFFLPCYRQFSVLAHNGIYLEDKFGNLLPKSFFDPAEQPTDFDTEDQGMKGYNLRSEPFFNRFLAGSAVKEVFASLPQNQGDPLTPVFYTTPDSPITFRLFMPGNESRATTFFVHNQLYYAESRYFESPIKGVLESVTVGENRRLNLLPPSNRKFIVPGDYMYHSTNVRWDIEQGMWGIMRMLGDQKSGY